MKFFKRLFKKQKNIDPEYAEAINQNFWFLVGAEDFKPCDHCQKKVPNCYGLRQGYTDKCKWRKDE